MGMAKIHVALDEQQVKALTIIETETDRPRTRVIRRAIVDYIKKYATEYDKNNPGTPCFMERVGTPIEVEKEFKPGVQTDVVIIHGIKKEMVVTEEGGWRHPVASDYVEEGQSGQTSILDEKV